MENATAINHVSDTATWVASYRAEETKRPDALFHDPLADKLVGQRSREMGSEIHGSQWVRWTVIIRTVVIDQLITELISEGVDTVVNLGAGLDTRPYRMNLPSQLRWIEIDFDHVIRLKQEKLADEKTRCQLQRRSLDLSDRDLRRRLFAQIGAESKNVLILTEGVIPYLTEQEVAELCADLKIQKNFRYLIAEYLAPHLYGHFKNKKRVRQMKNAPFRFMPTDWYGHFEKNGWQALLTRYLAEESEKLGRPIPMPWWARLLGFFLASKDSPHFKRFSGFVLFAPK